MKKFVWNASQGSKHYLFFFCAAIPLPPDNITLLSSNPPTFSWRRPPLPNGCMVNYKINFSNCGVCPSTVSDTTVACENMASIIEQDCYFSIQAIICGGTVKSAVQTFIASTTSGTPITTSITQPSNGNYMYMYSGTPLSWTVMGQTVLSFIVRCP